MDSGWSLEALRAQWRASAGVLVSLFGLVAAAVMAERLMGLGRVQWGSFVAVGLASLPALAWLAFFVAGERRHQAPAHFVAGVCALGVFVAAPLADFLTYQAVPAAGLASTNAHALTLSSIIYAVLVVGLIQELCKYAAVRYSAYLAPEFREPADGIIYMMACGSGFSVWVNYHRFSEDAGGATLGVGMAEAVITLLAHASFAAVLGAVMGRARFTTRRAFPRGILLAVGLLAAATANGAFSVARGYLAMQTTRSTWQTLLLATMFATAAYVGTMWRLRRAITRVA